MTAPQDILTFWFDETPSELHFKQDDELDRRIRDRFGAVHEDLSNHIPDAWLATHDGLLAAIIVLDQFSRNLHRGSARAFAQDQDALHLAQLAIERGWDQDYSEEERQFLYMPFMHGENMDAQDRAVELFTALRGEERPEYALGHRDIIERFGRFPNRNAALGRETTPEEQSFLDEGGGY
jgi:uncharacterized protein (DUF924 family)|tara:strand:- start:38491 stop:39030 length:540 start_codon:yes stop_codon:yes gene_type:complete